MLRHCLCWLIGLVCTVCCILQVRFAKHVFPGETLQVEMWPVSPTTVVFQTRVKERNVLAITNAAVEFHQGKLQKMSRL